MTEKCSSDCCVGSCAEKLSPAEINIKQAKEARCCEKATQSRANKPAAGIKEHDKIVSRTTGKSVEISLGPNGGGLVPKNPFASISQSRFAHANPEKFGGTKGLKEWDKATDYKALPLRSQAGNRRKQ
jgi:hypothetical protein